MPSSLTRVISRTLVFSTYPPVADYGTDTINSLTRSFSWQCGVSVYSSVEDPRHASGHNARVDLPALTTYTLVLALPIASTLSLLRPSADNNEDIVAQEYQPVIHRLRFSASA